MLARSDMRPYQAEHAVPQIKNLPNCALWMDMGLGKSVSTLTAVSDLIESYDVHKALVIAPLRVARRVWTDEIDTWAHLNHLRASKILGTPSERYAGIKAEADIYTINRENVEWLVSGYGERIGNKFKQTRKWPWDMVIVDESSSFKSQAAVRFKSLKLARFMIDRVVELTGTPAPNGLTDLWAQIYLLDRGERLGRTITDFRNRWFLFDPYTDTWKPTASAEAQIKEILSDIVISMRAKDYLDLPPVLNNFIRVSLTKPQRAIYKELERKSIIEYRGHKITAVNGGVLYGKLLQLANGAVYTPAPKWEPFHDQKLDAVLELIEPMYTPVIVAYQFQSDLDRLRAVLPKLGRSFMEIREKGAEDRWNAGDLDVILLHGASAGHGLNMQFAGSESVIWFGLPSSLELYQQTNARITGGHRRVGKSITIHHIVADGTVDEDVVAILSSKEATQERLLDALRARVATGA